MVATPLCVERGQVSAKAVGYLLGKQFTGYLLREEAVDCLSGAGDATQDDGVYTRTPRCVHIVHLEGTVEYLYTVGVCTVHCTQRM